MAGEWKVITIGEIATLQRGFDISKKEQTDGAVPVISSGGIGSYHDEAKHSGPGVLLGRKGTLGSVYWTDLPHWPHSTTLWVKDFHGNDPKFVYYFFKAMGPELLRMDVGAANPTLNRNHVHPLPALRPPIPTQRAIASVLGTLDDLIELNRETNELLEEMARALFKSWFVDFDPVRAKLEGRPPAGMDAATAALFPDHFQDSELGQIPKGWEAIPLYNTAKYINGAAFKSDDFSAPGVGLPIIKIGELKQGVTDQTKWSEREASDNQVIDTGDLVYSWSGSPDTSLDAFLWCHGRGLLNQHIFKVVAPSIAQKHFVYYLLQYLRPVLVDTAKNKQTTGLGHVTVADMKRILVCWPGKEVLEAFDRIIGPIFDSAFEATLESRDLATLRDTLLPKLLSGEVSVAEVMYRLENLP